MRMLWGSPLLAACIAGPGSVPVAANADFELFVEDVQPVLAARCANPSCHGTPERPLELFAVHHHRLDAGDVYRDDPLTEIELRANFQRSCGLLADLHRPQDCPLVRKPLAEARGGSFHVGGAQFQGWEDPELNRILSWIETAVPGEEG